MVWVILIVEIIVCIVAAVKFGDIAEEKGFERSSFVWFSILLPPAGWIMVAALPDRKATKIMEQASVPASTAVEQLPDL